MEEYNVKINLELITPTDLNHGQYDHSANLVICLDVYNQIQRLKQ